MISKEKDIPLITAAGSNGAHMDIMKDYDLVILAPQVASYYEDLKKDTDRLGIKSVACEGKRISVRGKHRRLRKRKE